MTSFKHSFTRRQVLATGIASGLLATGLTAPAWAQASAGAVLRPKVAEMRPNWRYIIRPEGAAAPRHATKEDSHE